MKKLLIVLFIFLLFSCSRVKKPKYHYKEVIINDYTITYPSISEPADSFILNEIMKLELKKDIYVYFDSYKDIISYKIDDYDSFNKTITFNYDSSKNQKCEFNRKEIIELLNKKCDKYAFKEDDFGFLNIFIDGTRLEIYLSSYITYGGEEMVLTKFNDSIFKENVNELKKDLKVALTFDDGPSSKTKEIVDLLEDFGVKATFFVLGENVKYYPENLSYIFNHNHEIGNHSYNHPNFKTISYEKAIKQIEKTENIIYNVIKYNPRIFRFPYGSINKEVLNDINLVNVLWNVDSLDWKRGTALEIFNRTAFNSLNGSIILFHDFKYYNKEAISNLIRYLLNKGYQFVTVSELIELYTESDMKKGVIYYNK